MESLKNNKNVATSDLSESAGSRKFIREDLKALNKYTQRALLLLAIQHIVVGVVGLVIVALILADIL